MKKWLDETPDLGRYRFQVEDLFRQQEHVLDEEKEKLYTKLKLVKEPQYYSPKYLTSDGIPMKKIAYLFFLVLVFMSVSTAQYRTTTVAVLPFFDSDPEASVPAYSTDLRAL